MKAVYLFFRNLLLNSTIITPEVQTCQLWNNYLKWQNEGKDWSWATPAIFLEFTKPIKIEQLGGGTQEKELIFRVHIIHEFLNQTDGSGINDNDVTILDLSDKVYQQLQEQLAPQCSTMVRISEEWDYDHNNLYHFVQEYRMVYIDNLMNQPVNGISTIPPQKLVVVLES